MELPIDFVLTKLHAVRHKWRFIYMVTWSHAQFEKDEITDVFVYGSSVPDLKKFCGKRRQKLQKTMLRLHDWYVMHIHVTRKVKKNLKVFLITFWAYYGRSKVFYQK